MSVDTGVPADRYAVSAECSHEEFLAAARVYARAVTETYDLSVPVSSLDWEVSTRAKRRAGAVRYRDCSPEAVVLTWGQLERAGWDAMAATIRHELVHVHRLVEADDPSHGEEFDCLANRLDAPRHCDRFTEPKWWVSCIDCDTRIGRYRRCSLVESPEEYRCDDCGGRLRVENTE